MQLDIIKTWNRGLKIVTGMFWIGGLLLAGSEGSYMPWGNILGVVFFWGASILMARQGVPSLEKKCGNQGEQSSPGRFKTRGCRLPDCPGTGCEGLSLGMAVGMVHRDGFSA